VKCFERRSKKVVIRSWIWFIKSREIKNDVFCHSIDVHNCYDLDRGDVVEFEVEKTDQGPRAINVKIVYN